MNEIKKLDSIFIELINEETKVNRNYSIQRHSDLALCYLFEAFRNNEYLTIHLSTKESLYDFHKGFRQYDIVEGFDSVFWQLISASDIFPKAYDLYCNGVSE